MNKNQSDQSQNEGFHINQPCIDSHKRDEEAKEQKNNKEFQPRYIAGTGILRKQPKECYEIVSDIPIKQQAFRRQPTETLGIEEKPQASAYEVYNNLNEYSMVYSRNKQPLNIGTRCAFQNEIILKSFEYYREDNFKNLKDFDQKSIQQQLFTDNTLAFDSRFQCGNLLCAYKSKRQSNNYTLFIQNDTNTYGYNQWFYFSIKNVKKNVRYTFKIANYRKSYSFFKLGMKPLIFSLKTARSSPDGNGWYRDGQDIRYYKSNFIEEKCSPYYTFEFTLQFQFQSDYITISPYAPYSFSRLMKSLSTFQKIAAKNDLIWKMRPITRGLTNTDVPYITISKKTSKNHQKQSIVIIARQHPGQTWSSFLAEEIMLEIVEQKSDYSRWITQNYIIKLFPMVNVDGVVYGNFRCDLAGYDLNRAWKNPIQSIHPQIFGIKVELEKINEKHGISLCLDLHTHSKEFGAFAYCCVQSEKGRELPLILSKVSPLFRYPACTFGIQAQKQSTARASIFHLTKNINIITIQLSAFGFKSRSNPSPHMYSPLYIRMIAKVILYGYQCYKLKKEPQAIQVKTEGIEQAELERSIQQNAQPVSGSDSEPQIDQIQLKVRIEKIFPEQFVEDIFVNTNKKSKKNAKKYKKVSNFHQAKPIYFEKPQIKKIKTPEIQSKTQSNKTETKNLQSYFSIDSVDNNSMMSASSPPNRKQSKFQSNSHQPLYKKPAKIFVQKTVKIEPQRPTKPLNLIEFSLKKLPIVAQDKLRPTQNYLMEELIPIVGGASYLRKDQNNRFDKTFSSYEPMCRPRVRANSRKIGFTKEKNQKLQEELPYLCVMSQNQKLAHFQQFKIKINEQQSQSRESRTFHNSILNGHNKHRNTGNLKIKDSQKYQKGDITTKIHNQFARYDDFINWRKRKS